AEGDILEPRTRVRGVMIDGQLLFAAPTATPNRANEPVLTSSRTTVPGSSAGPATPPTTAASTEQTPPRTPDDPTPPTPRAAKPDSTTANPLPERRPPLPEPAARDLVIRNATIL